jgi:hypothetical protein
MLIDDVGSHISVEVSCSCRCEISMGSGSDSACPVVCQEVWAVDDEQGVVKLMGLQALAPEVHLAKHVTVIVDEKQRQTAMWALQAMNECVPLLPLLHTLPDTAMLHPYILLSALKLQGGQASQADESRGVARHKWS